MQEEERERKEEEEEKEDLFSISIIWLVTVSEGKKSIFLYLRFHLFLFKIFLPLSKFSLLPLSKSSSCLFVSKIPDSVCIQKEKYFLHLSFESSLSLSFSYLLYFLFQKYLDFHQ